LNWLVAAEARLRLGDKQGAGAGDPRWPGRQRGISAFDVRFMMNMP